MMGDKPFNPLDILAVQNTLARYCEALDAKDWALLSRVFTRDVAANYPFNADLQGVEAVQMAIRNRLGPVITHHALSTQRIEFSMTGEGRECLTASATTYFVGSHFGQGPHEGKVLQAYGKYVDELVCLEGEVEGEEGVRGASGVWRIRKRTVGFMKRIGDENIMKEF